MVAANMSLDQLAGLQQAPSGLLPWADPYIALLVERHYLQSSPPPTGWPLRAGADSESNEE